MFRLLDMSSANSSRSSSSSSVSVTSSQLPSGLPPSTTGKPSSVAGVPSSPVDLSAAHVSERFITLSWKPPVHSGSSDIIGYIVYCKETTSERLVEHLLACLRVINLYIVMCVCGQMTGFLRFEFRVSLSLDSRPVVCLTCCWT